MRSPGHQVTHSLPLYLYHELDEWQRQDSGLVEIVHVLFDHHKAHISEEDPLVHLEERRCAKRLTGLPDAGLSLLHEPSYETAGLGGESRFALPCLRGGREGREGGGHHVLDRGYPR